MTLGQWGAGSTLAGQDILPGTTPAAPMTLDPQYDPTGRVLLENADGTIASINWADEAIAFALTVALGSIPCAPTIGSDRQKLKRATDRNSAHMVQDIVRTATAFLVDQNAVAIDGVEVFTAKAGRLSYKVRYRNLTLVSQQSRIATITGG